MGRIAPRNGSRKERGKGREGQEGEKEREGREGEREEDMFGA